MSGDGFLQLLRAEWTKFRTVRGWVIGMVAVVMMTVLVGLIGHSSCSYPGPDGKDMPCSLATGPGNRPVTDAFYFVHQPLAGDGGITVRLTSMTGVFASHGVQPGDDPMSGMQPGLEEWSKVGVIVKESTSEGAAYAAMMVAGGHGVRMQYNFTGDKAGTATAVSAASPRWLRLVRSGETLTGYESPDGSTWTKVGTAHLKGMASTVQIGLFATSPGHTAVVDKSISGVRATGGPTLATGVFDHIGVDGTPAGGTWEGGIVGDSEIKESTQKFEESGGTLTVTGSGDIAPAVPGGAGGGMTIGQTLTGTFAGLIGVVIVAAMFITVEYRRGLIRTTLVASPRRWRVLAAKATVIGVVTFVAGFLASLIALPIGKRLLRDGGVYVFPTSTLTELRVIAGTAGLLAVSAVLALGVGALLRRSAAAVTAVVVGIVLPYLLAVVPVLPDGVTEWLLRLSPAAAFAIQQTVPRYEQVTSSYMPVDGYFPLPPWGGFAVLCGYALLALGLAIVLLRRRDA